LDFQIEPALLLTAIIARRSEYTEDIACLGAMQDGYSWCTASDEELAEQCRGPLSMVEPARRALAERGLIHCAAGVYHGRHLTLCRPDDERIVREVSSALMMKDVKSQALMQAFLKL
jgi:hypothetical protein